MPTKIKNMTKIIGLKDLRLNTGKYVSAVEKGRTFTVVRRSRPIFKMMPVDEWGDEGVWKTLVDFRDKKGNGIKAEDLLKMLKKIDKNEKARKIA